jgi:hypothetical protein
MRGSDEWEKAVRWMPMPDDHEGVGNVPWLTYVMGLPRILGLNDDLLRELHRSPAIPTVEEGGTGSIGDRSISSKVW